MTHRSSDAGSAAPAPNAAAPHRQGRGRRNALLVLLLLALGAGGFGYERQALAGRRAAVLHLARGVALQEKGDLREAVAEFERATRRDPRNGEAWYLLATARRQEGLEGSMEGSLAALEQAARRRPNEPIVARDYGIQLREADQLSRARSELERAVRLAPTDTLARVELARAYLARVEGPEDLENAVHQLRTALELQPGDVQARFRLARALFQADDLAAARREFETVLALLDQGGRQADGLMDGRTTDSAFWTGIVKGAHHFLGQMAYRERRDADARWHRKLHLEMKDYIDGTMPLFSRLKNPEDAGAAEELASLYRRFGFPAGGPTGADAAARWIPGGTGLLDGN
jgi:Flp pilus assembly protein TadD